MGNYKTIYNKVMPTFLFLLLFALRFSTFYEIPGIRVVDGISGRYPLVFFIPALMFLYGVWAKRMWRLFRVLLEDTAICLMILYEVRYLVIRDYYAVIGWMRPGFWAYMLLSICLAIYCLLLCREKN